MTWFERFRQPLSGLGSPPRYWNPESEESSGAIGSHGRDRNEKIQHRSSKEHVRRRHENSKREARRRLYDQKRRCRCGCGRPAPDTETHDDEENGLSPETKAAWQAEVDRQFRQALQIALTVSLLVVDATILLDVLIVMALGALAVVCRYPEFF
ncbi:MAG: hypothetical protein JSW50_12255 [Candidatus Latescibacterota bacterium]|nr:MAG: hypothetical protein JSW50_12255 [Candidatus Latescibacterota bacterium]